MPTEKQKRYIFVLLRKAGLPVCYMSSSFKGLATMRERSGTVESWIDAMSVGEASETISRLKDLAE